MQTKRDLIMTSPGWDELGMGDMPNEDMRMVAETCGLAVAIKIMKELPGIHVNIPNRIHEKIQAEDIVREFDGHNARKLALKWGLSLRKVYRIIRKSNLEKEALGG